MLLATMSVYVYVFEPVRWNCILNRRHSSKFCTNSYCPLNIPILYSKPNLPPKSWYRLGEAKEDYGICGDTKGSIRKWHMGLLYGPHNEEWCYGLATSCMQFPNENVHSNNWKLKAILNKWTCVILKLCYVLFRRLKCNYTLHYYTLDSLPKSIWITSAVDLSTRIFTVCLSPSPKM